MRYILDATTLSELIKRIPSVIHNNEKTVVSGAKIYIAQSTYYEVLRGLL
jgi:hypothetical protein